MTASRDPDRMIHAFLFEGEEQLHDQIYDAVRAEIEQKRQRVVIGPWRLPTMNKLVGIGLGAAAVVGVLLVGSRFLGAPSGVGGPSIEPSPSPSVAASPSAGIAARPFVLSSMATVTIAALGWGGDPSGGTLFKGGERDGAGMIGPWHEPLYVYGDPCHWSTTTPETPATTVDEVVAALASQASRDASPPVDVTLDGYPGKWVTLHVPEDLQATAEGTFPDCDEGKFGSWGASSELAGPARYSQFPGQIDEVWIVDIDGQAAVIDGLYYATTPPETVVEMRAIINSIDFKP